jgi:uncharacterized protein with NRDE domain
MCTLAAYVGIAPEVPLLVAANRDEFLDRPTAEPAVITHAPWIMAGQDLTAGGTWLGVNESAVIVGLLNRPRAGGPDPTRRSRGLLCLELLQSPDVTAALARVREVRIDAYNSFNLFVGSADGAFVASNTGDALHVVELERGVHVLSNAELNDPRCPRVARAAAAFAAVALPAWAALPSAVERLRAILADHSDPGPGNSVAVDALCVHRGSYGTRSSTIIAVAATGATRYWHASGPPCRTPFRELDVPSSSETRAAPRPGCTSS